MIVGYAGDGRIQVKSDREYGMLCVGGRRTAERRPGGACSLLQWNGSGASMRPLVMGVTSAESGVSALC